MRSGLSETPAIQIGRRPKPRRKMRASLVIGLAWEATVGACSQDSRVQAPPKSCGRLPALGGCDTIGDHPVSVVRHSGPLDMKLEITA